MSTLQISGDPKSVNMIFTANYALFYSYAYMAKQFLRHTFAKCRDPKGSLARVTEMSQPLPTQFSQPPSAASLLKERRIEISQIGQQKAVRIYFF